MQVTATVEVAEGTPLAALEDAVARTLNKAGRELIAQAMPALEEHALEDAGGARQHREPRFGINRRLGGRLCSNLSLDGYQVQRGLDRSRLTLARGGRVQG